MSRIKLAIVVVSLGGVGCAPSAAPAANEARNPAPLPGSAPAAGLSDPRVDTLTVGSLLARPAAYQGREVLVPGRCLGWNGPALGQAPVSRSDWQLGDAGAAVWVSAPYPAGCTGAAGGGPVVLRAAVSVDTIIDRARGGAPRVRPYLVRPTKQ